MIPKLYTWNGNAINDDVNYTAWIPKTLPIQPPAETIFVRRAGARPSYAGKTFPETTITFGITCLKVFHTQFLELNKWFNIDDETPYQLIVKDTSDTDKQYYVYGVPKIVSAPDGVSVYITLALSNPIWQSVTVTSDTWNVTASGDNDIIANTGNYETYPQFEVTPTALSKGTFQFIQYISVYPQSTRAWPNRWLDITGTTGGGWNTSVLIGSTSISNQINSTAGITAIATSIPLDTPLGGGLSTDGGLCYVDTEQIYYKSIAAGTMTVYSTGTDGFTGRGWAGTVGSTHADNAAMKQSKANADGSDCWTYLNGQALDKWYGTGANAFNNTATKIFVNVNMLEKSELTTLAAISAIGIPATITFALTSANLITVKKIPKVGRFQIDSEEFTYTAKTITAGKLYSITVNERAARNTTAASHATGSTARFIPFDIKICYGNPTQRAQEANDSRKPVIDLTSNNTSAIYTSFADADNLRSGKWQATVVSKSSVYDTSDNYTVTNDPTTDADPAEVTGCAIQSYAVGGVFKPSTAEIAWIGSFPDGISAIVSAGSNRRTAASWPALMGLQQSADGIKWTARWTQASPATSTWTAWSSTGTALIAGTQFVRFVAKGTVAAGTGKEADFEATSATVTLVNYPIVTMRGETSNFQFAVQITNGATGESIYIDYPLPLNKTLYIDTNPDFPFAKYNGQMVNGCIALSATRAKWLKLLPGNNTLTLTASSVGSVTIVTKHTDAINYQ